jgi:protein-tyrosine phosphatase
VIDVHSHILAGLDDGARSIEESREIARRAADEGVSAIVATPHVRADYPTTPDEIEAGVEELNADLEQHAIAVRVLPGAEIDVGVLWQIPSVDLSRLTLGQTGRYLLLETPYRGSPVSLLGAVARLRQRGITTVLAHPERNPVVQDRPNAIDGLLRAGALVQVTAASLDGRLGRSVQLAAEKLLQTGTVHVLASDAHSPALRDVAFAGAVESVGDDELARFLTQDAPAAIIAGRALPEPPQRARVTAAV